MAEEDGNGWVDCARGHRHWGRYGAAGLLAGAPNQAGQLCVLLIHRAAWSHHGGTWGPPGGARDSHESAVSAALREATEECAMPPGAVRLLGMLNDDHGGWSYQTLIAGAGALFPVTAASPEAIEAAWVPEDDVASLPLHPGFAVTWPVIRMALEPVTVIVDGANVMGSRADGWWRDRAGAIVRLHDELAVLRSRGVAALPDGMGSVVLDRWFPQVVLVIEGAARAAADRLGAVSPDPGAWAEAVQPDAASVAGPGAAGPGAAGLGAAIRVVAARGSGDDAIASLAGAVAGRRLVVTADRELRRRCEQAGASVTGPRWLLSQL